MVLSIVSANVFAVTSPLGVDDYVWNKPGPTNLILGAIAGDTGDYRTLRYEDILFLSEAFDERDALSHDPYSSNTFSFVVSDTNRFWDVEIKKRAVHDGIDYFLSDTCKPSQGPRVIRKTDIDFTTNSAFSCESWLWSTNRYPFVVSSITQVMTNGTVNIFTNRVFDTEIVSNILNRVTTTNSNVRDYRDFCVTNTVITMKDRRLWKVLNTTGRGTAFRGPYSTFGLTNHYALARAMRFTLPEVKSFDVSETNATATSASYVDGEIVSASTNYLSSFRYDFHAYRYYYDDNKQSKIDSEWQSDYGFPQESETVNKDATVTSHLPLRIKTGISNYMLTYRYPQGRIKSARVYALVWLTMARGKTATHTTTSGIATDVDETIYKNGAVMIPIGTAEPDFSGEFMSFKIDSSVDVYRTACSLVDIDYRDFNFTPDLPEAGAAEWKNDSDTHRTKSVERFAYENIGGYMDIYVIMEINPKTKLPNWSEYE